MYLPKPEDTNASKQLTSMSYIVTETRVHNVAAFDT